MPGQNIVEKLYPHIFGGKVEIKPTDHPVALAIRKILKRQAEKRAKLAKKEEEQ